MADLCDFVGAEFSAESTMQRRIWGPRRIFLKFAKSSRKCYVFF